MDLIGSIIWRYATPERTRWQAEALEFVKSRNSRLPTPYLPIKAAEVLRVLDEHRPKSIVEFGSGHSTAWFAAYASETGATFTSFEHSPEWAERAKALAGDLGPVDLRVAKTKLSNIHDRKFIGYDADVPAAELIYVDGPSAEKDVADFNALDAAKHPEAKLILVDGRLATVDALRAELDVPHEWSFAPSINFAFRERSWRETLKRRAHSIFIRTRVKA